MVGTPQRVRHFCLLPSALCLLSLAAQPRVPPASVDFLALASDGRPVRDLKPEEVVLRVDGRTRTIESLQLVQLTDRRTAVSGEIPPPPPFSANGLADAGRSIVVVFDDESIRPGEERRSRESLGLFLAELPERDRVALVTVPHGGVKVDFTTDRAKVRQALAEIVGQGPSTPPTGAETACQTRLVLEALSGTLESLGGGEGPTTVIFLSAGLVGPRSEAMRRGSVVGMCELTPDHFNKVAEAAARARAQFYVIVPEHVMVQPGPSAPSTAQFGGSENPFTGLEHLTGLLGGSVLHLAVGAGESPLTRAARETSVYYVATFQPDAADRTGDNHRLEVRATRSDVQIRARSQLAVAKADAHAVQPTVKTPGEIVRDFRSYRDLPLRAAAFSSTGPDPRKLTVVADFESVDASAVLTSAAAGLFDTAGHLISQWTATPADLQNAPVLAAFSAAPGTYRLRIAAADAKGRRGAVDADVVVELTSAGSLQLSSMILGVMRAARFTPRLSFGAEPVAIAYLEIYGGTPNLPVAAAFEVSASLNGPPIVAVPGSITATTEAGKYTVMGALPVGALPPGDYVIRGIVATQGESPARLTRTLRKTR